MNTETEYNGWSNWQTWALALWLNNDEMSYNHMISLARVNDDTTSLSRAIKSDMQDLRGYHDDLRLKPLEDVYDGCLTDEYFGTIDFDAIADSFLED